MLTRKQGQRLLVVPAVDLLGDDAVRLERGDFGRVTNRRADPLALVETYRDAGAALIHLVDLDGARGGGIRPGVVHRVALAAAPAHVQASGGIRSVADAERLLEAGAARIVVGTAAFAGDGDLEALAAALGERLVVAVDVRGGRVAVGGWRQTTTLSTVDAIDRCEAAGVQRILCTAIDRDGTLQGPDLELLASVCRRAPFPVLAAGGVRSQADVAALDATGCEGVIVGRALLERRLPLSVLGTLDSARAPALRDT